MHSRESDLGSLVVNTDWNRWLWMSTFSEYKIRNRSFKSNENIHKKEGGSYYVVSAYKASSVTL